MHPSDIDQLHEMMMRIGLAMLFGAILGLDRELHRKPAGIRVLSMVSMGSCAIIMASINTIEFYSGAAADGVMRTVQGIISGIGFLGAGVIMRTQDSKSSDQVHGLTTAAAIWTCAILGMICGMGQWMLATSLFLLSAIMLILGRWVERWIGLWRFQTWDSDREPPKSSNSEQD